MGELALERRPRTAVTIEVARRLEHLPSASLVETVLAYHERVQYDHDEDGGYTSDANDDAHRLPRAQGAR